MRKRNILCLTLAILSGVLSNTAAQDFMVRPLPTQRLLPVASIHSLFQDSEGFMWYGTERAGACRDNGYQVDVFRPSRVSGDAQSDHIICFGEMADGSMLMGTASGLFCLSKKDFRMTAIEPQGCKIHSILTDRDGLTWIGLEGEVRQMKDTATSSPLSLSPNDRRPVASLYEDQQGNIFALEWQGRVLMKRRGETDFTPLELNADAKPVSMIEDRDYDCYWLQTSNQGIVRLQVHGLKGEVHPQTATIGGVRRNRGLSMLRDTKNGLLWVATMENLHTYRIEADTMLHSLPLNDVAGPDKKMLNQLLQSRQGAIYVASSIPQPFIITAEDNPVTRMTLDAIRPLTGYDVQALHSVREGGFIWIWNLRTRMILYDLNSNHAEQVPWKIDACFQRSSGEVPGLWASRANRLYHIWQVNGKPMREEVCAMPDSAVIRCIDARQRGLLYLATDRHLYRYSLVSHQLKTIASLSHKPDCLVASHKFLAWIMDGKLYLHPLEVETQESSVVKDIEKAVALAIGCDGTLWTATSQGMVFCFQPENGAPEEIPLMRSHNDAPFRDIAVDAGGHVWTVTDQQVREYNPKTNAFRTLWANSPQTNVAYFSSIEVENDNLLLINGAGALCQVESSAMLNYPATNVEPHLSSYEIDGEAYYVRPANGEIRLQHDNSELVLYLTTFDQAEADHVSFAYQLEGISRDWVYGAMGDNIIHFTKLPAGSYVLHVKATDRNGCWGAPRRLLVVRCLPPWYESWWARSLALVVAVALLYGLWKLERRIRLLHGLIRRREEVRLDEIELTREDITQTRLDDEFLRKAVQAVETHLSDPDFNVEALADEMCMSRANLHRRMKAASGLSSTDFIRDIRLKKAAQLFAMQPDVTITDVATRVGFATPRYFTKCFKEKFGVAPKDYVKSRLSSASQPDKEMP